MSDRHHKKRKREEREEDDSYSEDSYSSSESSDERRKSKKKKHKKDRKKKHNKDKKKKRKKKHKKKDKKFDEQLELAKKLLAGADESIIEAISSGKTPKGRELLDEEADYFRKSTEFRVWLAREKARYLDEMETKKAKKMFKKFVQAWNFDKLEDMYYKGIDSTTIQGATRTRHTWGFTKSMTEKEKWQLATTRDSVDSNTHHKTAQESFRLRTSNSNRSNKNNNTSNSNGGQWKKEDPHERTVRREGERKQLRHDRKQYNAHNKMVMEELAPKADPGSHAARREKRQMKGSYARNNQDNGGMADMREGDLMGSSGGSEYKRMLAKRAQRRDAKTHAKNERLEAYKQKEADTMKAFMNSMGLQEKFNM